MITVSGYQIEGEIYQNSSRAYYQATRNETNEKVIIKFHPSLNPGLKDNAQINHEYEILKNLKIPGIIQPEAKLKYTNGIALVIKDLNANPLTEIIKREKLEVSEALQIALSLAKALGDLHRHNIIHKDLQPENIFVDPEKTKAWIVDFRVSSFLPKEMPNIRNVGIIDGNLAYISPEQTGRMNRPVDYRTDFYSLGMTLYEMLTGSLPFNLKDPLELVHSHLAKQPFPPHQIDKKIPNMVSEIVLKLLSKTAEERYQRSWIIYKAIRRI
jgi:serine/threonine protein kinase